MIQNHFRDCASPLGAPSTAEVVPNAGTVAFQRGRLDSFDSDCNLQKWRIYPVQFEMEAVTGNEGRQLRGGGVCGSIVIPMVLGSTAVVDVAVAAVEASAMLESTATCAYMGEGKQNPRATDNPKLPHD